MCIRNADVEHFDAKLTALTTTQTLDSYFTGKVKVKVYLYSASS